MSEFDTRPAGTIMHGAFRDFARAERALRVLKNAGYLRSRIESRSEPSGTSLTVVTVDAAATGAARAAEILREYGAELCYPADGASPAAPASAPAATATALPSADVPPQPPLRPRNRKQARASQIGKRQLEVIIKTRGSDAMPLGESFTSPEPHSEGTT